MPQFPPPYLCTKQTGRDADSAVLVPAQLAECKREAFSKQKEGLEFQQFCFWEEKMKIWFKIMKENHLLSDVTLTDDSEDTRTHKIFRILDEACLALDLGRPIWLDANVAEFKRHAKTRFMQESFVETIAFDYLEMHVLEED